MCRLEHAELDFNVGDTKREGRDVCVSLRIKTSNNKLRCEQKQLVLYTQGLINEGVQLEFHLKVSAKTFHLVLIAVNPVARIGTVFPG